MTSTMQATVLDGPKLPFRVASIARPEPGPGEVLVRIGASRVNPLDTKIRAGQAAHAHHPLAAILGIDLAGTVEAVAPDVSAFRPGDEVYGMTGGVGGIQGSLADMPRSMRRCWRGSPQIWAMREAAALPLLASVTSSARSDGVHMRLRRCHSCRDLFRRVHPAAAYYW